MVLVTAKCSSGRFSHNVFDPGLALVKKSHREADFVDPLDENYVIVVSQVCVYRVYCELHWCSRQYTCLLVHSCELPIL